MDAITCINTRYSCRNYLSTPVSRELLSQLLDAGRRAPSGRKVEPVEYVVVTDQSTRSFLAQIASNGQFIAQAPTCIVVIARETTYYLEDGCAAAENILLASYALGLASCWVVGNRKTYAPQILQRLGVPDGYHLIAMLAIGYPAVPGQQPSRRPLEQVAHWERF